jgi:uncharacterized protein (TIGR02271 family)
MPKAATPPLRRPIDAPRRAIALAREELRVGKRKVETGRVRVKKRVREHEEIVREDLLREDVEVQRVPVDRILEGSSEPRREGDVLVIPVVEEVLVMHKQLRVVEELHVRRRRSTSPHRLGVVLRSEEATVERDPPPADGDASPTARPGIRKRSTQQRR